MNVYKNIKDLRWHPFNTIIQNVISMLEWLTLQEKLLKNSGTMGKCFLVIIPEYCLRGENIRLHLQAHSDLSPAFFYSIIRTTPNT